MCAALYKQKPNAGNPDCSIREARIVGGIIGDHGADAGTARKGDVALAVDNAFEEPADPSVQLIAGTEAVLLRTGQQGHPIGLHHGHSILAKGQTQLVGKLLIDTSMGNFLGDKRIMLLEAIDKNGSISQAAKAVPMSYKAAWDAVDDMNNLAPEPLVHRAAGGRHGGGTELTAFARRLIAFYRALEQESQLALEKLTSNLEQTGVRDVADFRQVLRRMSMKTSARNQFAGPVVTIKEGVVDTEVTLRVAPEIELTAIVTRESAENLGLAKGRDVLAFVKASSILLLMGDDGRISARNRFTGIVSNIHQGPVNAEVTLNMPGGQHVITAVITDESVKRLALAVGQSATAVFKAPNVFLVAAD
jgi:molybdate transport system regulatory protein